MGKNKNKNAFQEFIKKYTGKKDDKISSKDVKKFLGGGGSQSQAQKFLKKAGKQGIKIGGGATKQANKPAPYVESGGAASSFADSSGESSGPFYSGLDFDLGAFESAQGITTQNQAYLNQLGYLNSAIINGLRSDADKYVADAYAGAQMYGDDRQVDITSIQSAATERLGKYKIDQERASAYEVADLKGKYGLDLQNIVNAGLSDVAKISGEYGLEGEKVRGEYGLEAERIKGAAARDIAQRNKEAAIFGGLMSAFNF